MLPGMGVVHEKPQWRPKLRRVQEMNITQMLQEGMTKQQIAQHLEGKKQFIINCPCKCLNRGITKSSNYKLHQ